ncbi:MAG: hypothetical protein K2G32_00285 [Oscillospiraceae bacterium]|nr:hypothetical protein [Oscillospiraceae bacterium]
MKHIKTMLSAAIALSLCGCVQSAGEPEQNEQGIFEEIPDIQQMVNRSSIGDDMVASVPIVEETDNTRLAVDFIFDFYETLVSQNESALDLDKYFSEGELKEQMAKCKETLLEKKELYKKDYFAFDYVAAVSDKVTDGVHLITVDYAYHFRYSDHPYDPQDPDEGRSGAGMRAPFAIKDGKIVNLAIDDLFDPLPADENVPEVQVILSHITAARNGAFDLDGITYESDTDRCNIIIEDGGFIKLLTPEGAVSIDELEGETDELTAAVKEIYTLEAIGNTGRLEAGDITFTDAKIYRFGEKLLLVGAVTPPTDFDTDSGTYCAALLFAPDDSSVYEFVPFVDTNAAEYSYIELCLGGIDAYREDGTPVEIERLSDEDAEMVFDLMKQIRIDSPPLSRYTWREAPDGGYGAVFNVCRYVSPYSDYVSKIRVIPSGSHLLLDSMCFPVDAELSSQLSDLYHELYKKYYPDLYAKWYPTTDEV